MIFSVIISEKGGAERRESFERTEINVGRVQGNDLMLPKGNVSKRHARLHYRDGRFVVTDLKSTNGTYLNGRKISQPTIVREGDKIYVGDFVLRIEAVPISQQAGLLALQGKKTPLPPDSGIDDPASGHSIPSPAAPDKPSDEFGEPNHGQPDDDAVVPGPPRLPRTTTARQTNTSLFGPATLAPVPVTTPTPPTHLGSSLKTNSSVPPHPGHLTPTPPPPRHVTISSNPPGAKESVAGPGRAYRTALAQLIDRVGEVLDLDQLSADKPLDAALSMRIATVVAERAAQMKTAGLLPDGATVEQLVSDARRELLELGSLGPLLADDDVNEIHIDTTERVMAYRKSRKSPTAETPFTSERSLMRALQKISKDTRFAAKSEAQIVDVRTAEGLHISSISALSSATGIVVVLRKPQRVDAATLDDLVRNGSISRPMGTLLAHAVLGRTSMLVTGAAGSGHGAVLSALVNASGADERTIVLQDDEELAINHPNAVPILLPTDAQEASKVAKVAARMRPDRLVIASMAGLVADVLSASGEGAGSIIAATHGPTLRQVLLRLTSDLMLARPGMSTEAARECIAASFDLVIEVVRLRDGRSRALRIAELRVESGALVTKDIFVFNIDRAAAGGAIEGSHQPTGTLPSLVEDLAARGVVLDPNLFRRNTGK